MEGGIWTRGASSGSDLFVNRLIERNLKPHLCTPVSRHILTKLGSISQIGSELWLLKQVDSNPNLNCGVCSRLTFCIFFCANLTGLINV